MDKTQNGARRGTFKGPLKGSEGVGQGTPEERRARWLLVQRLLRETRSVGVTAQLVGVPLRKLSRWLNAPCRREWWQAQKRRWHRQAHAAAKARWRARKAQGLVLSREERERPVGFF